MRTITRKSFLFLFAVTSVGFGASINYRLQSTYGAGIPTTALTSAGATFSLSFSEPVPVVPTSQDAQSFTTTVPVSYTSGAISATDSAASVTFFNTASDGLFSVDMTVGGNSYFWEMIGAQIFSGTTASPALETGTFALDPVNNAFSYNNGALATFGGGSVTASSAATVPEPGSIWLLGLGLLAGIAVRETRKKRLAVLGALMAASICRASVPVDLSSVYNIPDGITKDGSTYSTGGLDGGGASYSANLLGTTQSLGGVQFNLGPANAPDAVNSATIPLPERRFSSLVLLATGVQGNQTSQTFVVTYTDGTTTTITQSLSDWFTPQNFSNETIALTMSHRNYSGAQDDRPFNLYAYPFTLDSSKSLASITLPNNRNVVVLAIRLSLTPVSFSPVTADLSAGFNRIGIVNDGSTFSGGLDGKGGAYSSKQLSSLATYDAVPLSFGPPNAPDAISGSGQTVALPMGVFADLVMLGTAVNGAQESQDFVINYTDGTIATFTQSLSDWSKPQSFSGESVALTSPYRDSSNGTQDKQATSLYAYFFMLNSSKIVKSITLPNNSDVEVLAITLSVLPVIPPPSGGICGTAGSTGGEPGSVPYFRVYTSHFATWCVNSDLWAMPASKAAIPKFFAYGDAVIAQDIALFKITPASLPFIFEITMPFGGAYTGNDFGPLGDTVTGDAFTNSNTNPVTNQTVPGWWGYLLPLHESINVFTGLVSPDWPTDWWADHRSPFPNAMDEEFMRTIGEAESNSTLLEAADIQHERFADPSQPGYDSEVAMFEGFYNEFGGSSCATHPTASCFLPFSNAFGLVTEDGLDWDDVQPGNPGDQNHGETLTEYVIAYLQLGFHTTTDLTSTFIADGVGTKDSTIPSYTPKASNVLEVANDHCSIRAAANAGINVSAALTELQNGHFQKAHASGGTAASCPSECKFEKGACVAPWNP